MSNIVLLVCEGDQETAAANQHVYPVVDGYCLVDTRPYELKGDARADATEDATQICSIYHSESTFGVLQRSRLYRPATSAERDRWLRDEGNRAKYAGMTVAQLRDNEVSLTAQAAAAAQVAVAAAQAAAERQAQAAAEAVARAKELADQQAAEKKAADDKAAKVAA